MSAPKPSRNARRPCGSGKKIKHCHGEGARRFKPVPLGPGVTLSAPPSIALVLERDSDLPERLVAMARKATATATTADAGDYEAITAILLINTAAEAVLNRLLESLVTPKEWGGVQGRNGLERAGTEKKWVKLSELLKMKPNLSRDKEPLRAFLKTAEVRHALVHFKHGKNIEVVQTPSVPMNWGGHTVVPAGDLARQAPARVLEAGQLRGALTREAVAGYFDSLKALLTEVTKHCPADEAHVALAVAAALQEPIATKAQG